MTKYKRLFPDSTGPWPSEEVLKPIRDRLSDPNYEGTLAIGPEASRTDKTKYALCQILVKHLLAHKLSQRELAGRLGIDESRMSDIVKHKIERFTIDRLIGLAEEIEPGLKIDIHAA